MILRIILHGHFIMSILTPILSYSPINATCFYCSRTLRAPINSSFVHMLSYGTYDATSSISSIVYTSPSI